MTAGPLFRLTVLLVLGAFSTQALDAQQMPPASIQAAPADYVFQTDPRPLFPPRTIGDHVILGMFAGAAVTGVGLILWQERFKQVRGYAPTGGGEGTAILLVTGVSAGAVAGLITGWVRGRY